MPVDRGSVASPTMAHQSLYRRYRPQQFSEVRGQGRVIEALRSAVAEERVGHAYLFSGPRGTGKTSTARILAKALNCESLVDGEPDGSCDSCLDMQAGTSYDLQELDAASNNKVEDVRALIERVALGSPGRHKVYILDEVHMLSAGASNALLKTLEEPPDHVVFVLATTDPQKVLPTIRSRTQHFTFHLLPADELADHVRWVVSDAGLDVDDAAIEHVLRVGGGSARDTLSALDQAASGGVDTESDHAEALVGAVIDHDTGAALAAVAAATRAGRDPRVLGEALLAHLRDVFLSRMGGPLDHLSEAAHQRASAWAERLGDRAVTRALEEVGEALLTMRQAPDPRIPLEVALVRLTAHDAPAAGADSDLIDALVARVERLERTLKSGSLPSAPGPPPAPPGASPNEAHPNDDVTPLAQAAGRATTDATGAGSAPSPRVRPADSARAAVGRRATTSPSSSSPAPRPAPPPPPGSLPSPATTHAATPVTPASATEDPAQPTALAEGDVQRAWNEVVVPNLRGMAKALFKQGTLLGVDGSTVTVGVPNRTHLTRCEPKVTEIETSLATALGRPVTVALVVGGDDGEDTDQGPDSTVPAQTSGEGPDDPTEGVDLTSLVDAPDIGRTGVDRVTEAFPGAQVLEP